MVCVADAAGCLGALAQGLRRDFASTARSMFPILLEKLKDKNSNVCMQCSQALATFHRRASLLFATLGMCGTCAVSIMHAYSSNMHIEKGKSVT